jgi:transposase
MRSADIQEVALYSYISAEQRVPADHPLRPIRAMVNAVLRTLSPEFNKIYSIYGRPSIPPERLLRCLLLQVLYTVRSERMMMEQLDYNVLYRWFVGLNMDDPTWDVTVFTKNRMRFLDGEETHASTTDPDARLYKKSAGSAAKLGYLGHVLMENRNGLVIDSALTFATGKAEREAALEMVGKLPGRSHASRPSGRSWRLTFKLGCGPKRSAAASLRLSEPIQRAHCTASSSWPRLGVYGATLEPAPSERRVRRPTAPQRQRPAAARHRETAAAPECAPAR